MSKSSWIMMAFIYTAKTGLNYRKYKRGKMSKEDFINWFKKHTVETIGSLMGGGLGSALGFFGGSLIMPGVGSAVGAIAGGIAGTLYTAKLLNFAFDRIHGRVSHIQWKQNK